MKNTNPTGRKAGGVLGNKGGRKKGQTVASHAIALYAPVREIESLRRAYREAVSRRFDRLVEAQLSAAEGVMHMQARDAKGRWETVVDPQVMQAHLDAGHETYRLSAIAPSAPILKDIMDRTFGQPKQSVDIEVKPTAQLSDDELKANMAALLKKLQD
jgi:hypothetical protein